MKIASDREIHKELCISGVETDRSRQLQLLQNQSLGRERQTDRERAGTVNTIVSIEDWEPSLLEWATQTTE